MKLEDKYGGKMTLLWSNPNPTAAFAQQTISIDLTSYDAVVIECNTSGNTATGRVAQLGFVGTTARLVTAIYQIHRRLAEINTNNIVFGNNYYLPSYATANETANNSYLIPSRIYGVKL